MTAVSAPPFSLPTGNLDAGIDAEILRVQEQLGFSLQDADPALIQHIVEASKRAGNQAFKTQNYAEAVRHYTQAIAGAPKDHTLFGNRSAAYLALGLFEEAATDAQEATSLAQDWPKAYYRLGCALLGLSQWEEAGRVLQQGLRLDPGNPDMAAKAAAADAQQRAELAARRAQLDTERRGIVTKLRAARRKDMQQGMVNQFKQSMAGPDWEVEDLEWRPTYLPAMRLKPVQPAVVLADQRRRMLAYYVSALADLAHPKQALRILEDETRMQAFERGIASALSNQPPGVHVLVLGAGGGLLSLLAARAGAGSVTAVERSRMLFRMAKQCLEANSKGKHAELVQKVRLLDRRLQAVGVQGEALPPDAQAALEQLEALRSRLPKSAADLSDKAGANPADASSAQHSREVEDLALIVPSRASVLVTDLLDHSVLGMGLLPALDYAAERLLVPGAVVVPQHIQVYAVLLELRVGMVSGFDLSGLNEYWWHPSVERLDLERLPHRRLSAPFCVHNLDLQARVNLRQLQGRSGGRSSAEEQNESTFSAREAHKEGDSSANSKQVWEFDATLDVPVTAAGDWNAVAFWFEVDAGQGDGSQLSSWSAGFNGVVVSTAAQHTVAEGLEAAHAASVQHASSWGPAVQYVDRQVVAEGSHVALRVRQDSGQYVFSTTPPQCRPRHALVPRWHFDMVLDSQRNEAYNAAIVRAVQRKRAAECAHILALDLGAGTGLLSMMAARAGADEVYATEISQHMCDVGEETCIMNGFFNRIVMLDRDARRLDVFRKADGTPPDLPRRADLLVYEVFDSGCIGEGVLHILAAAQAKIVAADAEMVPISARVFCQPIQMRLDSMLDFDCHQANRWRWRPDYEGLELGKCREKWVPLAQPMEVFFFDFRQAVAHMHPEEAVLDVHFTTAGVFNAVAMWFELELDEETSLSTSPYEDKGLTWQQAVQWVQELEVLAGQHMQLTARHDTYSISYSLSEELTKCCDARQTPTDELTAPCLAQTAPNSCLSETGGTTPRHPRPTGVPLIDSAWKAEYDRLQGLNGELAKSCVQNPLEFRAVSEAAVQFAARPHDMGLDAQQAAEFCVKMMG